MHCTCNVELRRVRVTIVAGAKKYVLHILSVRLYSCLSYPVGEPYFSRVALFDICVLSDSVIFFHNTS